MIDVAVAKAVAPLHAEIKGLKEIIKGLKEIIKGLEKENQQLKLENKQLKEKIAKLQRHSKNSSKPPSSNFFKKPKETPKDSTDPSEPKRKIGGQPGHPKAERKEFPPDQIDEVIQYELSPDEIRGQALTFLRFEKVQQVELPEKLFYVTEYRRAIYVDSNGKTVSTPIGEQGFPASHFGPRLKSMTAWMHTLMHASISNIEVFYESVFKIKMSQGMVCKCIRQSGDSLAESHQELVDALVDQLRLFIDETGGKRNKERLWHWVFVADLFTVILADQSRATEVLNRVLGDEFSGLIHCDYYNAYRSYLKAHPKVKVQHCLAHLVRELLFVAESEDENTRLWAEAMLDALRLLIHSNLESKSIASLKKTMHYLAETYQGNERGRALAKRLEENLAPFLRFLEDPLAETTNNIAERKIRPLVLHRKTTQGTRSEPSSRTLECLQTLCVTAKQQGISGYSFLVESLKAYRNHTPAPSLLGV